MSAFIGKDRRQFKRVKTSFIVMCKVDSPLSVRLMIGDREINSIGLNLSEGGMAILTNYDISSTALVTLKYILFNDRDIGEEDRTKSMENQGEVRYSLLTKERTCRIGIRFIGMPEDDRGFIYNFVRMAPVR